MKEARVGPHSTSGGRLPWQGPGCDMLRNGKAELVVQDAAAYQRCSTGSKPSR